MKKLFMVGALMLFVVSVAAGQNTETKQPADAPKTITGRVDSIDPINPAVGNTEGNIIIIDTEGNAANFTINADTVITDEAANKIGSGDIQDEDGVKVVYSETDLGNMAKAISRLKKQN